MTSVAFSWDDKYIISGSWDNSIKIWERETGMEIQTLKEHSETENSVAFNMDDKYIISGIDDNFIKILVRQSLF